MIGARSGRHYAHPLGAKGGEYAWMEENAVSALLEMRASRLFGTRPVRLFGTRPVRLFGTRASVRA